jgi:esterase/lipase superfamily enzyme
MNQFQMQWFSPALQQEMPIAVYGHYGQAILLIPTAAADLLEYERFHLIEAIAPLINAGKFKVFSVNSINNQSWLNQSMLPEHKAIKHNQFNEYIYNEVIPFIKMQTSSETPIYTCGASFGALHAMNLFLKNPHNIQGTISMSGVYNLQDYTKGYFDEQVYFDSPYHYIPNLHDSWFLDPIKYSNHIHIYTGSGNYEDPHSNWLFSQVLQNKNIPHELSIWGNDVHHDWVTWRKMLPFILESRF